MTNDEPPTEKGYDRAAAVGRLHEEFPFLNATVILSALSQAEEQIASPKRYDEIVAHARAILKA